MVEPLRHRQTKGAETDMLDLTPPRHVSTLPIRDIEFGSDDLPLRVDLTRSEVDPGSARIASRRDLRRPGPSGAAGGRGRRRCSGSPSRAGQRHSACQRASRETCVLRTSRPFRVAVRPRRRFSLGRRRLVGADHSRRPRKELAMRNRDQEQSAHGGGCAGAEENGDRVRQWR